ncbi:MAG: FtsX-like permease family protein, partial [Candidatus Hodarchaeota archaeon]
PLGIYIFSINEIDTPQTKINSTLLINKDTKVTLGPIGLNTYTLGIQAYLNKNPFPNAKVTIWSPSLAVPVDVSSTDLAGNCNFTLLEQDIYISIIKENFTYVSEPFTFTKSQFYVLNMDCILKVNVIWANNLLPISNAVVHIHSSSTTWENEKLTNMNGTTEFTLDPGEYRFIISKGEHQRIIDLNVSGSKEITLGLGPAFFSIYTTDGLVGLGANISVYENSTLINSTKTDEDGRGYLWLVAGRMYEITASYGSSSLTYNITLEYSMLFTFNFQKELFQVRVVNITTGKPVPFCKLTIYDFQDEVERLAYTDRNGMARLITSWGILRVFAEKNGVYSCRNFTFTSRTTIYYIFLGKKSFNITINGSNSVGILNFIRLSDQNVYSFNLEYNFNINIELEADTYTIAYSSGTSGFFKQEIYINGSDLSFQAYSVLNIGRIVDWADNNSALPNVPVRIIDTIFGYEFFSLSDENGELITNISPGMYEISIPEIAGNFSNKIVSTITKDRKITLGVGNCVLTLTVWNSTGNETLSNVNITLTKNGFFSSKVTDINGVATFDIPVNEYKLNITYEKDGQSYSIIQIIDSFNNHTLTQSFSIGDIFTLKAGVWNPNSGYPLSDENIQISVISEEINRNVSGAGLHSFFLPSNQYSLKFSYNSSIFAEHEILLNQSVTIVEDLLHLLITVKDKTGLGEENTTISLLQYPMNLPLFEKQTNQLGESSFYIPSSLYTLEISSSDYYSGYITLVAQFDTDFDFQIGSPLTIACSTPGGVPISNAQIRLLNLETNEEIILNSNSNGIAQVNLNEEEYYLTVIYENNLGYWNGIACLNIPVNISRTPFIQVMLNPPINLTIVVQNEFQSPITQISVSIEGLSSGITKSNFTDKNGVVLFSSIPWDIFTIEVGDSDITLISDILVNSTIITIFYPSDESIRADYSRWAGNRKYAVENPVEYVDSFLESSFSFLNVILFSFVALITSLVFLSFGPIVNHPILQSRNELNILKHLGTDLSQRRRIILFQLSLTCGFASLIGSILGIWAVLSIDSLKTHIIGGIAITPIYKPEIIIIIIFISLITTMWNIYRAVSEK